MSTASQSKVLSLAKTAANVVEAYKLEKVNANVVLVLDVSKSMYPLYRDGVMQAVVERLLALALQFDRRGQVDAFVFGTGAKALAPISLADCDGYIDREILAKHNINQATQYAKAMEAVNDKYFGQTSRPIYVIFLTDGDDSDKNETSQWLRQLCRQPYFWKFVGIGDEDFKFLSKLDELSGRSIDNAHFIRIADVSTIDDNALFHMLLEEFPQWLEAISQKVRFAP